MAQDELSDLGRAPSDLRPVRLGGVTLGSRAHVCAFFTSAADEYEVLMPFIKDGIALGEKAFHTVDPARAADHVERLSSAQIDVNACCDSGQLELRSWNDVHLSTGKFEPARTSSLFAAVREDAEQRGFRRTRFVSHMGWTALQSCGIEEVLAYEAQANRGRDAGPVSLVVCVYDLNVISADLVIDVMRTHPFVLVGGTLYENPLFVAPEEFLGELRERKRRTERLDES